MCVLASDYPKDEGVSLSPDMTSARLCFIEAQSALSLPRLLLKRQRQGHRMLYADGAELIKGETLSTSMKYCAKYHREGATTGHGLGGEARVSTS